METNTNAATQNNTLTENEVSRPVYYLSEKSKIKLSYVKFIENNLMQNLLIIDNE